MTKTGRYSKNLEQLPLAAVRKMAFKQQLIIELAEVTNSEPENTIAWINRKLQSLDWPKSKKEKRLSKSPSYQTMKNWFGQDTYPGDATLNSFKVMFPNSHQWLIPDQNGTRLQAFISTIDLFLIRKSEYKNRPHFNLENQQKFILSEFRRIYSRWVLGKEDPHAIVSVNISDKVLLGIKKQSLDEFSSSIFIPESVSGSLLFTHGVSALPFHLLSISDYGKVPQDCIFEWFCDLLISAVLVSIMYSDLEKEIGERYNSQIGLRRVIDKIQFDPFGTSPATIKVLCSACNMLELLPGRFKWYFEDGLTQGLHNIERIRNYLDAGTQELIEISKNQNIDWQQISGATIKYIFAPESGKAHLHTTLEQVWGELDSLEPINRLKGSDNHYHKDVYYFLTRRYDVPVLYRNTPDLTLLLATSESTQPAIDGHYCWGYYGTGPQNMATTILEDYCGHSDFSSAQMRVFMYRIISIFQDDLEYVISGTQLEDVVSLNFK